MTTVEANSIHKGVFIDNTTFAKTVEEAMQATEIKNNNDVLCEAGNPKEEYVVERIVYHR